MAFRYLPALDEARSLETDLQDLAGRVRATAFALDRPSLTAFQADVASDRERLGRLRAMLDGDPLIAIARALPPSRAAVTGADAVAAAGGDILDAADAGLVLAGRYVAIRERNVAGPVNAPEHPTTMSGLVELMATGRGEVDSMVAAVDRAEAALASAPPDLPGPIAHARDSDAGAAGRVRPRPEDIRAARRHGPRDPRLGWPAQVPRAEPGSG